MFEAYINGLRMLRVRASTLDAAAFYARKTVCERGSSSLRGWSSWAAGRDCDTMAVSWPWMLIADGVVALDPMRIQSNLLVMDDLDKPLGEHSSTKVLLAIVDRMPWQRYALKAIRRHQLAGQ